MKVVDSLWVIMIHVVVIRLRHPLWKRFRHSIGIFEFCVWPSHAVLPEVSF